MRLFRPRPRAPAPPSMPLADAVRAMHQELGRGSPTGVDERRQTPRRACVGPVLILPLGAGDEPDLKGRRDGVVVDISAGGLRILSRFPPCADRVVQLTLMGSRGGNYDVHCEVVRRRRLTSGYWEVGLRFIEG